MRKVLLSLLVLALACPTFAAVNIVAEDAGDGVLKLYYDCTDGEVIRGIALKIEVTSGDAAVADAGAAAVLQAGFNTFIDYAFTLGATYDIGVGHPLAKADQAGALDAFPAGLFSVSLGALDQTGNQLGVSGNGELMTIAFDLTEDSVVSISVDTLRGGIVGDNITAVSVQASQTLVAGGGPSLCLGDVDGDGWIDLATDLMLVIDALEANEWDDITPVPTHLLAADMDGDGVVDLATDLMMIIDMLEANDWDDIQCP